MHSPLFRINRRQLFIRLLLTEAGFALTSVLALILLPSRSLVNTLQAGVPVLFQLGYGIVSGLLLAVAVLGISEALRSAGSFGDWFSFWDRLFKHFQPTYGSIAVVSLAAGVGEEFFFRAFLQPTIGILLASFVFGLLHLGMGPSFKGMLTYAAVTFLLGILLGLIFAHIGLLSAICAHAAYDFLALASWKYLAERRAQ